MDQNENMNKDEGMNTPPTPDVDTETMHMPETNGNTAPVETMSQEEPMATTSENTERKGGLLGPIVGILIILILLIIAGLYIRGAMVREDAMVESDLPTVQEAEIQALDEIEATVDDIDVDAIDAELQTIEEELDAELNNL